MIKTLTVLAYLFGGAESHQVPMELKSAVVQSKKGVSVIYVRQGKHVSIPLVWRHIPPGTRSLALVMYVKSAPKNRRYLWAIYNLPPQRHWIKPTAILFRGGQYAENSWGHFSYDVSSLLRGKQYHSVITLYALKARFYFHKKITTTELLNAMRHYVITTAKIKVCFAVLKKRPPFSHDLL